MRLLRELGVLFVLMVIGIIYLSASGVRPDSLNLSEQVGIAIVTGSIVVFFQRLVEGKPDNEVLNELNDQVEKLTEQVARLNQTIEERDAADQHQTSL